MSNRLRELRERQAVIVTEARERLEQISAQTDEARVRELEGQHDTAMAEYDRLETEIAREERVARLERDQEERRARRRPNPGDGEGRGGGDDGARPLEYRQVFHDFLRRGGDVSELNAEERQVLRNGALPNSEFRAQTTTGAAGGYTVPTELAAFIVKAMKAWGPMYDEDICTVLNTASGAPIKIPTVDDTAVTAEAHTEGTPLTDDGGKDVTFGQKSLDAYVFDTEFVRLSMELAQDSVLNVETLLAELLGERLGRIANSKLTVGTGSSQPNGVVTASSLGKTAAGATAITSDEIIDLLHSVDPAYRQSPKARFMFNDMTLSVIRKLKDGQGNYLWQMGDITKGSPGTLLGFRYEINQAMDSIAAAKKIMIFGDFGKYFVRKVGAPAIGVLRERFWPDLGIAGLIRFDGELGDTTAIKHLITAAS